jgi:hypothetical protein
MAVTRTPQECFKKKHPLYERWRSMKKRCEQPDHRSYRFYGEKGTKVCDRWQDFYTFEEDVSLFYEDGLVLDRINPKGDYSPENCRWINSTENVRRQSNVSLTMEIAIKIRQLYRTGNWTQQGLARMFGTSRPNISLILSGKRWKEVI